jgi:hypothetical protein
MEKLINTVENPRMNNNTPTTSRVVGRFVVVVEPVKPLT